MSHCHKYSAHIPMRPNFLNLHFRSSNRLLSNSSLALSGHNKWSKIKEGKGINDKLKSQTYARARREIILALKGGISSDPAINTALATAILRAKQNGIPKSNIQSALEQAQRNQASGSDLYQYEVLFAGKIGLLIECLSDNNARTVRDLKSMCKKHEAQMASVAFMFDRKMNIHLSLGPDKSYETLWNYAVDNGAHDISGEDNQQDEQPNRDIEIITSREEGGELMKKLKNEGYDVLHSEIVYMPVENDIDLDEDTIKALDDFVAELENYPDTHNINISPRRI